MIYKLPKSFLFFFCLFPIADVINGWLLSEGVSFRFGVMYRLLFLGYCMALLLQKKYLAHGKIFSLVFINVIFFSSISLVQSMYFNNSMTTLFSEFTSLTKYFLGLIVILVFVEYPLKKEESLQTLININLLFVIGLLIPYFLHVGNYTYENSTAGYKGFYFATNDITYTFVLLITLMVFHIIDSYTFNNENKRMLLWGLFFSDILSLFLIGTKFGLVYIILISSYLIFHLLLKNIYVPSYIKFLIFQSTIIVILFIILVGYKFILSSLDGIINRITYFYRYYDGDLIKIITSSRSIYLGDAITNFLEFPRNYAVLFFGFGVVNRNLWFGRSGTIEMDLFDTFFSYGSLGVFLLISTIICFFVIMKKRVIQFKGRGYYFLVVTLIYSFLSGHVFYSGMSMMMFGYVFSQIISNQFEIKGDLE